MQSPGRCGTLRCAILVRAEGLTSGHREPPCRSRHAEHTEELLCFLWRNVHQPHLSWVSATQPWGAPPRHPPARCMAWRCGRELCLRQGKVAAGGVQCVSFGKQHGSRGRIPKELVGLYTTRVIWWRRNASPRGWPPMLVSAGRVCAPG
mgnify:CR=1 FL=1